MRAMRLLQISRLAVIFCGSLFALLECALTNRAPYARALWLHRWCRVASRVLGLRVERHGLIPNAGLLVSNHLSYLDIIVFSALQPCVFVAKSEVARWPVFGSLARAAGTLFLDRTRRSDAARVVHEIGSAIRQNLLVVLFPEGTSTDGTTVLPFKSALLAPAVELECCLTAAAIAYSLDSGSVADEVCYWRDMSFLPHLWNVARKSRIAGTVSLRRIVAPARDRKELAEQLRSSVKELRFNCAPHVIPARPTVLSSDRLPA